MRDLGTITRQNLRAAVEAHQMAHKPLVLTPQEIALLKADAEAGRRVELPDLSGLGKPAGYPRVRAVIDASQLVPGGAYGKVGNMIVVYEKS